LVKAEHFQNLRIDYFELSVLGYIDANLGAVDEGGGKFLRLLALGNVQELGFEIRFIP
jgi:hypothetical protein